MSGQTEGPWTVHTLVERAIDGDLTHAGLFEIEEVHEEIVDAIQTKDWERARKLAAANKAVIQAAPKMAEALRKIAALARRYQTVGTLEISEIAHGALADAGIWS